MAKQPANNSDEEGLFGKLKDFVLVGLKFNSAFGKILYLLLSALFVFGYISVVLIKNPKSLVIGSIFSILLFIGTSIVIKKTLYLFETMTFAFMDRELVLPVYNKMILYGQNNKKLKPINEKSTIVKVQTISAKARIINPKVSTEIKKLEERKE